MIEALSLQRDSCEALGSTMYRDILDALLDSHLAGGPVVDLLSPHAARPVHDAVPLRLLGAVHLAVLRGVAPRLSRHYPSVGGVPGPELKDDFLAALVELEPLIRNQLTRQVQTNEVGRSIVPLSLLNWLGSQGINEVDWLEIGSSAGLNLCFDSYSANTGSGILGATSSSVSFGPEWFEVAPTVTGALPRLVSRRGTDLSPIDIHDDDQALRLTSFVWPDHTDRLARLRAAIRIARAEDIRVTASPADHAVRTSLSMGPERTTVVFHSIVWQYLDPDTQQGVREALSEAGQRASRSRQLIWARMEPAGPVADVQVDIWDGSRDSRHSTLATIGYHGRGLRWIGDRADR